MPRAGLGGRYLKCRRSAGTHCREGTGVVRWLNQSKEGIEPMPQQNNYAADAGRIAKLQRDIRSGALSAGALVERCLARIDAVDPVVQAWRHVARDSARAEADLLDREAKVGRFRGPLHGIPVGIKDIIDVAGITTLANSKSRVDSAPATADADIVAALRLAGAVILGKTHTTEFAYLDPSPACNPHNVAHTPGGSSSGSAAAVGAGTVPMALGTQTVASVNRPAAYCGVAAFKPSTQSTCTHGMTALAPAFDTVGFYGATVADAVALYDAVAPAFTASFDRGGGPRYNIVRLEDPTLEACDAEILKRVGDAATSIAGAAHAVRTAASPEDMATLFETQRRVMQYEASRIYRALLHLPEDRVGPKLREMIGIGLALSETDYRNDRERLAAARATFWVAFPDADAILFPATPQTAPTGLASTGDPRYIGPWTALGGPIVTQPVGHHANGLPIGMLVCGRPGSDRALARVACSLTSPPI
jgi:aspartyl-tRNA(Asn)/glutamyl-tRNA(Gln) amidotransferase subunit A